MKKKYDDYGNGVSYVVEFSIDKKEREAVKRFWPELTFPLKGGEGWGVMPDKDFFGVAWVDGNPLAGGKFRDGVWRGIVYPKSREKISDIEASVNILYDAAMNSLASVMEKYDKPETGF